MAVVKSGCMLETLSMSHYRGGKNVMTADNQQERLHITEQLKWFLAGLIEGDGSVSVSIKAHPSAKFGYYVDPEFFLYQVRENKGVLELARRVFGTGHIRPKRGNERVLVYSIECRRSLAEKLLPFLRKYMLYSPRRAMYERFSAIVEAMERKEHHTQYGMKRIVEEAYALNPTAKSKGRKRPLSEVVSRILRDYTPDPRKGKR
jgi:hypothetical protein